MSADEREFLLRTYPIAIVQARYGSGWYAIAQADNWGDWYEDGCPMNDGIWGDDAEYEMFKAEHRERFSWGATPEEAHRLLTEKVRGAMYVR